MNGNVVHSGDAEFTLINKLLSNEYITTHTQINMGTASSRSYNSSGAYNDNAIKISNVYASYPYYGRYKQTFNGTYTFTLPINITIFISVKQSRFNIFNITFRTTYISIHINTSA